MNKNESGENSPLMCFLDLYSISSRVTLLCVLSTARKYGQRKDGAMQNMDIEEAGKLLFFCFSAWRFKFIDQHHHPP